jgi:hypothetical protein
VHRGTVCLDYENLPALLPDGWVITFGYHSSVMGKKRGFAILEICLILHGGAQQDTIVTVEERIKVTEQEISYMRTVLNDEGKKIWGDIFPDDKVPVTSMVFQEAKVGLELNVLFSLPGQYCLKSKRQQY